MRILHIIPAIAARYGGPSTSIGPMCSALQRCGITVEIATTDANGPDERLALSTQLAGVTTHVFARTFSERWKFSGALWRWLRRHAGDYDLVHLHANWSFATAAGAAAARRSGVPYVLRPAGMLSAYTWNRGRYGKKLYWALVERRVVSGAAAFHATSRDEAHEIEMVQPGARVFVVPQAVNDEAWQIPHAPETLRQRCGPAARQLPILLFLSRLHPKKGITDLLLPALTKMRSDAFLAIVGGTDDHAPTYEKEIRQTVARLGLNDRVAMLGSVQPGERWELFDGAAAFVLPSHSENFGIVVAEAMARGCPVIVSDAVQAGKHVTAAGAGQVVPCDAASVAAACDALLADPLLRSKLGAAGPTYAAAHLTWDRVAEQILAMYQSCLPLAGLPVSEDISAL